MSIYSYSKSANYEVISQALTQLHASVQIMIKTSAKNENTQKNATNSDDF